MKKLLSIALILICVSFSSCYAQSTKTILTVSNTLFVNKGGVDASAKRGRLDLPFLTIAAAQTAASSGDEIIVYPGTYSEGSLGKAGINYHLMNGAIISSGTSPAFTNSGSLSYTISGDGEIITTSGTPIFATETGTISVTARKISSTSGTTFRTGNSAVLYANIRESVVSTAGDNCILLGSSYMYVRCPVMVAGGFGTAENQSATSFLYLEAQSITSTGSVLFQLLGTNYIHALTILYTGTGTAIGTSAGNSVSYIYGNINLTGAGAYVSSVNNASITGSIDFYGRITGTGGFYFANCDAAYKITIHGDIDIDKSGQAAIIQGKGVLKVKGLVRNSNANVGSFAIDVSSLTGTCIIQNAILVTGAGGAMSIYSASNPTNVIAFGSNMAKTAKDAAVTIVGGTLTVNANVQ